MWAVSSIQRQRSPEYQSQLFLLLLSLSPFLCTIKSSSSTSSGVIGLNSVARGSWQVEAGSLRAISNPSLAMLEAGGATDVLAKARLVTIKHIRKLTSVILWVSHIVTYIRPICHKLDHYIVVQRYQLSVYNRASHWRIINSQHSAWTRRNSVKLA